MGKGVGEIAPRSRKNIHSEPPKRPYLSMLPAARYQGQSASLTPWSAPGQLSLWSKVQRRHLSACTGQPQLQKKSDRVVGPSFGNAAAADKHRMYTKHQL